MSLMQINPKEVVEKGYLKLSPYSKIQQIGIDLSIEKGVEIAGWKKWELVRLNEEFHLPSDVFAILFPRSTMFRNGMIVECGVVEPGYEGRPVVAIHIPFLTTGDVGVKSMTLSKGYRVVQAIFFKANSASIYNGSYQGEGL